MGERRIRHKGQRSFYLFFFYTPTPVSTVGAQKLLSPSGYTHIMDCP